MAVFVVLAAAGYTTEPRSVKEEMLSRGLCPNGLHAGAVARSAMASEGLEAGLGFWGKTSPYFLKSYKTVPYKLINPVSQAPAQVPRSSIC